MWTEYKKLAIGYGLIGLLGLATAGGSLFLLRGIVHGKDLVIYGYAHDLLELQEASNALARKRLAQRAFLLTGEEGFTQEAQRDRSAGLARLSGLPPNLRHEAVFRAEARHEEVAKRAVEERRRSGSSESAARIWDSEVHPESEVLEAAVQDYLGHQTGDLEHARRASAEASGSVLRIGIAILALLVPAVAGTGYLVTRSLARLAHSERSLSSRIREQAAAVEFGRRAMSCRDLPGLIREAVTTLAQTLQVPLSGYLELVPPGAELALRAGVGWRPGEVRVPASGHSFPGCAVQARQTVLVEDLSRDARFKEFDLLESHGIRSGAAVPVTANTHVIGILGFFSPRSRAFGVADVHFAETLAYVLAAAVVRAREEENLRASEERARLILEATPDYALFLLDPQGRIASWNGAAERMKGYRAEEVLGRSVDLFYTEEDRKAGKLVKNLQKAAREGRAVETGWRVRKDGSLFWADLVLTALRNPDGTLRGFIKLTRDIDEQRTAQEELREAREHLQSIVDHAPAVLIIKDREGRILLGNREFERQFGVERERFLGQRGAEVLGHNPFGPMGDEERRVLQSGETLEAELAVPGNDGVRTFLAHRFPLRDRQDRIYAVCTIATDITARKRSEEQFRLLVESVEEYALILVDPEGRVASWNPAAERLLGYPAGEIVGQPLDRLFPPEDQARGRPRKELHRALAEGRASDEMWLARKDGSRFWASGSSHVVRDPSGRVTGLVKIFRDLTRRKRYEEEIERLNTALEERLTERTLQLEGFAYTVAHDLRAPLRAMNGFSHSLLEDYGHCLDERGVDYARRIMRAAARMDTLIQDLLDYSRLSGTEFVPQPIDLGPLVKSLLSEMDPQLRETGAAVELEAPLGRVQAHGVTLKQVVYNLLSNAMKFVPEGVAPRVRIHSEPRNGHVRLWVEDNGIGIAPEYRDRVFGVFERLHPGVYSGTGIGLAIVKKGIEGMGGTVGVESQPGEGSRFWVELPRADEGEAR